jgi:hypothetical protein
MNVASPLQINGGTCNGNGNCNGSIVFHC